MIAFIFKKPSSSLVIIMRETVRVTIQLYDKLVRTRHKICDIGCDYNLMSKFERLKSFRAQCMPKLRFSRCRIFSHFFGAGEERFINLWHF